MKKIMESKPNPAVLEAIEKLRKLHNPRIDKITFHTFRHFKATMEYHKTKDILHVMKVLGHKNINNTLIYTQLVDFKDDEYTVKVAEDVEEDKELIEAGFEYVTDRQRRLRKPENSLKTASSTSAK